MTQEISIKMLSEKQMVMLDKGKLVPTISEVLIDSTNFTLSGVVITTKNGLKMVPATCLLSLTGDVIVAKGSDCLEEPYGKNILNLPIMTPKGVYIGKIVDSFMDETKKITKIIIDNPNNYETYRKIELDDIDMIGKDVILTKGEEDAILFTEEDLEEKLFYNKRFEMKKEAFNDEIFDKVGKKISTSVNEVGSKLSSRLKQVDSEQINQEIANLTNSINREIGRFVEGVVEYIPYWKQDYSDSDVSVIYKDLSTSTVSKPIQDKRGEVIIMPGQLINEDKIRQIIAAEKVADLYRLATPIEKE